MQAIDIIPTSNNVNGFTLLGDALVYRRVLEDGAKLLVICGVFDIPKQIQDGEEGEMWTCDITISSPKRFIPPDESFSSEEFVEMVKKSPQSIDVLGTGIIP